MEILLNLIDYFGIDSISSATTLPELLQILLYIFFSLWIIAFFLRSVLLLCTLPERGFF